MVKKKYVVIIDWPGTYNQMFCFNENRFYINLFMKYDSRYHDLFLKSGTCISSKELHNLK